MTFACYFEINLKTQWFSAPDIIISNYTVCYITGNNEHPYVILKRPHEIIEVFLMFWLRPSTLWFLIAQQIAIGKILFQKISIINNLNEYWIHDKPFVIRNIKITFLHFNKSNGYIIRS